MSAKQSKLAQTSYRTRFDPPTLEEAIFAAQGLAGDIEGQTQIAAMLMGLPEAEVRAAVMKATAASSHPLARQPVSPRPTARGQAFVVERRATRGPAPIRA